MHKIKIMIPLNHFILYSKGWYNQTDDVVQDLIKILQLDGFSPFDKNDVLFILVNRYEKDFKSNRLVDFISNIHPNNCWKVSYFTKGNCDWLNKDEQDKLPEYDYYTAVIYKIISHYRFFEVDKLDGELSMPKYSKENPRPKHIELKTVIERWSKKTLKY